VLLKVEESMKYWLNVGFLDVASLGEVARVAEDLGYEGVSFPDHLFLPTSLESPYPYSRDGSIVWPVEAPWPDAWAAISALALATTRLRFTTTIYIAPLRDVFSLAKSVSTAAAFGPGRVACGLGTGWMREEFDIVGQEFDTRGTRLDEMIEVLSLLFTGEPVSFEGTHVSMPEMVMRPAAPGVPVLIGGTGAPALRRAARADGWIAPNGDLEQTSISLAKIEAERERLGRSELPFEVLATGVPRDATNADVLNEIGVDGLVLPVVTLAAEHDLASLCAGMERFANRWIH